MIQLLSVKYRRQTAFFILLLFYANTVLAGRAWMTEKSSYYPAKSYLYVSGSDAGKSVLTAEGLNTEGRPGEEKNSTRVTETTRTDSGADERTIAPSAVFAAVEKAAKTESAAKVDIGGPGQPEMSAFKSVGADNMVDLFTGDFSYNIALGDVGGYPINIFYNSGITMDQEASWVGLGWNINPGTITRNLRGLPDDFNGQDKVEKEMNMKPQITVGVSTSKIREVLGIKQEKLNILNKARLGVFYNNYRGVGLDIGKDFSQGIPIKSFVNNTADYLTLLGNDGVVKDEFNTTNLSAVTSLSFNLNSQSGMSVNPSLGLALNDMAGKMRYGSGDLNLSANYNSRTGLNSISISASRERNQVFRVYDLIYVQHNGGMGFSGESALSFASPTIVPSIRMPLTHKNISLGLAYGKEGMPFTVKSKSLSGYYTEARIAKEDKKQTKGAYGYLYYQLANGRKEALLDFNRLNDVAYTKNNPVIAIPNYTYDVFSISGEGTGGSFRAYRGDVGSVHDHYTKTKEDAGSVNLEFGKGNKLELGVNLNYVHTPATAGEWIEGNKARESLRFRNTDKTLPAAYFKNPGESALIDPDFLDNLGGEDLVRVRLYDVAETRQPITMPSWERFSNGQTYANELSFVNGKTWKTRRDKRSQVISYLTAEEAEHVALDKKIQYYGVNQFPDGTCSPAGMKTINRHDEGQSITKVIRRKHHLSEISVLQTDGKRYIYGIPVYNLKEKEVSFNVGPDYGSGSPTALPVTTSSQTVTYNESDLSDNKRGKDHFYESESVDPYAHSFLLSGIVSSDYVDVSGNGITDDDLGTAVKFNYTKIEHPKEAVGEGFGWRAPFTKTGTATSGEAAYNPGLKTDQSDDKASYTYGERELWYLNSIESKNMIAIFTLAATREDGKAAAGEFGNVDQHLGMKKLSKIDIYVKSEWTKTSGIKKPLKTIHFDYYEGSDMLCNGTPTNYNGGGKLTLKSIYFTFNGNEKSFRNRYYFKYHSNPGYDRMAADRWGNYKPGADNSLHGFAGFSNADFPFALQNKAKADQNAGAWTLNEIILPSGAKINVEFESDDYAYVQNRRATQMFKIAGFGKTNTGPLTDQLYSSAFVLDNNYIFIDAPVPVSTAEDVRRIYLDGINQLFMKLWVKMPHDQYNPGSDYYEPVPLYAFIEDCGVVNSNRFWIKVKNDKGNFSPMFYNSMQFLIKNLPSKAYPGSDVKESNAGVFSLFKMVGGMLLSFLSTASSYYLTQRRGGTAKNVDLSRSFIRLDNPSLRKLGGGIRVKKVTITDNWKKMTATDDNNTNGLPDAVYGQEYDYTKTELVNGVQAVISSGVASYEPIVGAEENPFREIMYYDDRQPLGPFERGAIEMPLGETFFPSAFVGYSKVTVRSIHRDNVKSGVGRTETEFYTTREFPTKSDFISFDENSNYRFKSNPILRLLKVDVRERVTLSQGFRVQTNDMNGKIHTQTTFDEKGKTTAYTENIYRLTRSGEKEYKFDNVVQVLQNPGDPVSASRMGKEIEVMTDFREHITRAVSFNLHFNIDVNQYGTVPVPVPSFIPPVHFAESGYKSASVLKVVHTFGILDKVRVIDKGSEVSTKNLVYDAVTGNVLVTETNNEFNKPLYSFNYPAHWAYTGMQGAAQNIDAEFKNLRFQNGKLTTPGFDMTVFESGDELYVSDRSSKGAADEPGCYPSGPVQYIPKPVDENGKFVRKIWALQMSKDPDNADPEKFLFIDKDGNPYSGGDVFVKIIRSGKRNLLDASVGGFTSMANPVRPEAGNPQSLKLTVDDETKIINTTANTFKENWRVDEAYYVKKSTVVQHKTVPIRKAVLYPVKNYNILKHSTGYPLSSTYHHSPDHAHTNLYHWSNRETKEFGPISPYSEITFAERTSSNWLQFDFNPVPAGAGIHSAKLSLLTHSERAGTQCANSPDAYSGHPGNLPQRVYVRVGPFGENYVQIRRMKTPWYSNAQPQQWENIFSSSSAVDMNSLAIVPSVGNNDKNFVAGYNTSGQLITDERIDLTTLVRDMVEDIRVNNQNYAYGLKLEMSRTDIYGGAMKQQCFSTLSSSCPNSFLEVYYYNCNENTGPDIGYGVHDCGEVSSEQIECLSHFSKTRINPYTKGVLGNWRADLSYVYYGNRREGDATAQTEELKKGGIIETDYKSFWMNSLVTPGPRMPALMVNMAALLPSGGSPARWKWNSKITQINSKGFELENTDPLGRFNSGIYGYDKSLPLAVANNAKLRNIAFDGFEDYSFKSSDCNSYCKPKRHFVIENAEAHLDNTTRHSGVYSLKTSAASASVSAKADIVTKTADEASYGIDITTITTSMNGPWVDGLGTGIKGRYHNFYLPRSGLNFFNYNNQIVTMAGGTLDNNINPVFQDDPCLNMRSIDDYNYDPGGIAPPPGIGIRSSIEKSDWFCAKWEGYIQAPETGQYKLRFTSDDGMRVWIGDENGNNMQQITPGNFFSVHGTKTFEHLIPSWVIGSLHKIVIYYFEKTGNAEAKMSWVTPYGTDETVPKDYLYLQKTDADNTLLTGTHDCVKPNVIQVQGNAKTDVFSPVQGQKMVFSAWVKEGNAPCQCTAYENNKVEVFFDNGTSAAYTFLPSGRIIEGWQRYEAVFDIPGNGTNLEIKLSSLNGKDVYWDDIRVQPYNSNMKSFVYHPVTLRLMAEQDENNYCSYYEYDEDGTLTRVKKETAAGIKTITETRSALQKKITQ